MAGQLEHAKDIIQRGLDSKKFREYKHGNSYCNNCKDSHPKLWFSIADPEARFYLCLKRGTTFVVKQNEAFKNLTPEEFQKVMSGSVTEKAKKGIWPQEYEVTLCAGPPFISVTLKGSIS